MVALTDFTAENGGTHMVPGSHLWNDERTPDLSEAVPTEMKAGSAALFLGTTYHGGGANQTENDFRTGFTMALDSALIRQEENMYLSLSPEVVRSYPEQVQRLLGWASHPVLNTGWVDIDGKMADPNRLLGSS
jgi:ectoine hydroxylase-related dioxygenase (phytanoyl-CoA dioxygenase family)